ncbi:MAG: hypothetical protein PUD81_04135 [Eggerthellales bacterium]|nr:hypothetical protein [Eggerthellales bacterium]
MLSSLFAMLFIMVILAAFPLFVIADVCATLHKESQQQVRRVARHQ